MDSEHESDIWIGPARERCTELALVLEAQGIAAQVRWNGASWVLSVPASAASLARMEIEAYVAERRLETRPPPLVRMHGNPWPALGIFAAALIGFAFASSDLAFGIDWLAAGRVEGGRILDGEWWRVVTALTLHADAAHLLGNLFFGAFFAYTVGRYIGNGFGWLTIVVCGACGNLANVWVSGADHRSIGASTAVFAALGLLSAYCWRRGFPDQASSRERMAPVVAGIGLLAFTGTGGANTDIGAHLFGFAAGFVGGLVVARINVPTDPKTQRQLGAVAVAIVGLAWIAAIG